MDEIYRGFIRNISFATHELFTNMLGKTYKRKPLVCLTNTPKKLLKEVFKSCHPTPSQMMPDFTVDEKISDCKDTKVDIYLHGLRI